jgi:hypothetical protein
MSHSNLLLHELCDEARNNDTSPADTGAQAAVDAPNPPPDLPERARRESAILRAERVIASESAVESIAENGGRTYI